MERRFQPVMIPEPTVEDTISILRGLKERYEVFHGVKIHDGSLIAAATLSNRYITDRFLPDKAIDLVDEACALIKTEMNSMPSEMDEVARKIMQHEIEEAALKKEDDRLSKEHLKDIQEELANMRAVFNEMKSKWDIEKQSIEKLQRLREKMEQTNADIECAQNDYDLAKAAELKYGKLPEQKNSLKKRNTVWKHQAVILCFVIRSARMRFAVSWQDGRAFPYLKSWKANVKSYSVLKRFFIIVSSVRIPLLQRLAKPSFVPAPV